MKKIGITGGIGSGKTTVCRIFESIGIPIYYSDIEAKRLMTYNKLLKRQIKDLLGSDAYHRNGRLNRREVARLIFSDKEKLRQLNLLVHPAVKRDAQKWHNEQNAPYTIQEAALFVENGSYRALDKLILVTAPVEVRINRVIKRDKSNYEAIKRRVDNQLTDEEKRKVSDYIIDNSGNTSLVRQVWDIHQKLTEQT